MCAHIRVGVPSAQQRVWHNVTVRSRHRRSWERRGTPAGKRQGGKNGNPGRGRVAESRVGGKGRTGREGQDQETRAL